ncbi:hypothetical protein A2774_03245 [Candidatus Roizmanbacteria bacterium RIFCSPHIGHO2_01_FULL_39_12c]|uniref:Uncharacterized protein n=1 Tax=Candidatus Roizmanbacteria bacterium RIFCSPHIGHO2_01_FULL_39_12c TaxID=1802031 RepID=A0A1F7GCC6_9BACT|nr:MAG: hypothetical protein A2774_03245 [Candidatus Roizmanbacteria bacterium RIFCSPHIGHO2_01_FULL_39_12c]OGK46485.1 MAG: hypothetical protein A2963_01815 [Candidatus Roizmanbacteria bacterium RIFCSPLOWO2_01_FULL_40_13]
MVKNYTPVDNLVKKHKKSLAVGRPKEAEPVPRSKEKYIIKEAVEHKPEEEVRPFVQSRAETLEIPPDLQKHGLEPVSGTNFPSYQNIKTPLSDEKIIAGRHEPVTSSLRWLSALAEYILAQAHLALKIVHGKIIRVVRS